MYKKMITAIAMIVTFAAMSVSAGVIVDSITGADNRASMGADAGQTFTTGTLGTENLLSTIDILGDPGGAANGATVTAKLWEDTDGTFTTWDPGTLVATSVNSLVIAAANSEFTFNFSNEALSDSKVYVLSFNDGANDHVEFRSALNSGGDSLSDGALFAGGAQPFGGAYDASIRVTTVAVPEPSAFALIGLSGLVLFLRRRK